MSETERKFLNGPGVCVDCGEFVDHTMKVNTTSSGYEVLCYHCYLTRASLPLPVKVEEGIPRCARHLLYDVPPAYWTDDDRLLVARSLVAHRQDKRLARVLVVSGVPPAETQQFTSWVRVDHPRVNCDNVSRPVDHVKSECLSCRFHEPEGAIPFMEGFLVMMDDGLYYRGPKNELVMVIDAKLEIVNKVRDLNADSWFYRVKHPGSDVPVMLPVTELSRYFFERHCVYRRYFADAIRRWANATPAPVVEGVSVFGFVDRWLVPPGVKVLKTTEIQAMVQASVERRLTCDLSRREVWIDSIEDDEVGVIKRGLKVTAPFRLLGEVRDAWERVYRAISVDVRYRDLLVALGAAAPFFSVVRDFRGLMPAVMASGSEGGTGKTSLMKFTTIQFWGCARDAEAASNFNTESASGDYLSASTFPILVDEVGDLNKKVKEDIKSYLTSGTDYARKLSVTEQLRRNRRAPLFVTANSSPAWMEEAAFITRILVLPFTKQLARDDEEFDEAVSAMLSLPAPGRLVFEATRDWTRETVERKYAAIESEMKEYRKTLKKRGFVILCLYEFGRRLVKKALGVELPTHPLAVVKMIRETPSHMLQGLKTDMRALAAQALQYKALLDAGEKKPYLTSALLVRGKYAFWTRDNLRDLQAYDQRYRQLAKLTDLAAQLKLMWGDKIKLGTYYVSKGVGNKRAIRIPVELLEDG